MTTDPPEPAKAPADIDEAIAKAYLEDRAQIREAGAGLRTTAQWIMSTIGAVAVALTGGVAVFSNLGHLSGWQWPFVGICALVFLIGVAEAIRACSNVMRSQDTTAEGHISEKKTAKMVGALGPYYANAAELTESVKEAAKEAAAAAEYAADRPTNAPAQTRAGLAAARFMRHHAAQQKLFALIWYEKVLRKFQGARERILISAVIASLAFVGFMAVTQKSAADAERPTKTAELRKTRAEARNTRADAKKTEAETADANADKTDADDDDSASTPPPPGTDADKP
jgi:hypothetical protein